MGDRTAVPNGYRRLAGSLDPYTVSAALDRWGWSLVRREPDVREIWELGEHGRPPRARVMVPLARDYVDFGRRFADLLTSLGLVYGLEPDDLSERITARAAAPADQRASGNGGVESARNCAGSIAGHRDPLGSRHGLRTYGVPE